MRSDDLSLLLRPQQDPGTPFRQGTVLTYNVNDGSNTIDVGGATLTDVPLLNISDVTLLSPGDVVVLMKMRESWAIMGRVVIPGSEVLATGAIRTATAGATDSGFEVEDDWTTIASNSLNVPGWANRVLVMIVVRATVVNTSGADSFVAVRGRIGGQTGGWGYSGIPDNTQITLCESATDIVINPGSTVLYEGQIDHGGASGTWPSSPPNILNVNGIAIFYRL